MIRSDQCAMYRVRNQERLLSTREEKKNDRQHIDWIVLKWCACAPLPSNPIA